METPRNRDLTSYDDPTNPSSTDDDIQMPTRPSSDSLTASGGFISSSNPLLQQADTFSGSAPITDSSNSLQPDPYQMNALLATSDRESRPSMMQTTPSSTAPIPTDNSAPFTTPSQHKSSPSLSSDNLPDVVSSSSGKLSPSRGFSRAGDHAAPTSTNEAPLAGPVGNGITGKRTEELTADAERAGFIGNTDFGAASSSDIKTGPSNHSTKRSVSTGLEDDIQKTHADIVAPTDKPTLPTSQPTNQGPIRLPMPGSFDTPQQSYSGDMPTVSSFSNNPDAPNANPVLSSAEPTNPITSAPAASTGTPARRPQPSSFTASSTSFNSSDSPADHPARPVPVTRPTAQALESFNREIDTAFRSTSEPGPAFLQNHIGESFSEPTTATDGSVGGQGVRPTPMSPQGSRFREMTESREKWGMGGEPAGVDSAAAGQDTAVDSTARTHGQGREERFTDASVAEAGNGSFIPTTVATGGGQVGESREAGYGQDRGLSQIQGQTEQGHPQYLERETGAGTTSASTSTTAPAPKKQSLSEKMKHMLHMD